MQHYYVLHTMSVGLRSCDTADNRTAESAMQSETLEVIRRTKLDIAQWIAAGMEQCANPMASHCLARYAAAQLEAAALIPASGIRTTAGSPRASLLRSELRNSRRPDGHECIAILVRVSRATLVLLAGDSSGQRTTKDVTIVNLMRHEARAAMLLMEILPRRVAA